MRILSVRGCMFVVALLVLVASALFVACGGDQPERGQAGQRIFRMNLGTEPPDLDPARMRDLTSFTVIQPLMKGLTQFDEDARAVPAIAERWDIGNDGMRYVFHLRKDARWSDGKPVTADDFIFAWKRALDPAVAAEYAFFLFEIKNAKAYYDRIISDFDEVGAHKIDDHTLAVDLQRPTPFFLDLMAAPVALPLREDALARHGDRFTEAGNFITNGAYQMDAWVHEEQIILSPNPYFYGPRPQVDKVLMLMVNDANTSVVMYENNELDFIETTTSIPSFDVRRLRSHSDARTANLHRLNYFGFNTQKPPFDDPRVRQAFALALEREYYPRLMQSGEKPTASLITEGLEGYNSTVGLHFDPEKAQELLAEAGYPGGKDFPTVTLAYRTGYDVQKECEIAQFLWKKHLKVDVRLENMEWKVFLSQLADDPPPIFRLGWFVDYPDADSYMGLFISASGNNHTHWKNARYDELVARAVVTPASKPDKRQALYDKAQRLLLEEAAVIVPIYQAQKLWLVKPHVKNLKISEINLIDLDTLIVESTH